MLKKSTQPNQQLSDMRRILRYITPFWQFKAILVTIIVTTFLDILTPAIIGSVIDTIGNTVAGSPVESGKSLADLLLLPAANWISSTFNYKLPYSILGVYVGAILAIAVAIGLLNYLSRYISAWLSQKATYDMRSAEPREFDSSPGIARQVQGPP